MRRILTPGAVKRLRRMQEDNMTYHADIFEPPSTTATTNGQPSKVPVLIACNVKCRVSPISFTEQVKLISGQVTDIPKLRIVFPIHVAVKDTSLITILDHPEVSKVRVISKAILHQNSTAQIAYCSK